MKGPRGPKTPQGFYRNTSTVPDFPRQGISFKDITPLIEDGHALHTAVDALAETTEGIAYDRILSAEARGFVFGTALAYRAKKGLILARKPKSSPERSSPPPTTSNTVPTPWKPTPTRSPRAPASSSRMTSSQREARPAPCASSSKTPAVRSQAWPSS